MCGSTLEIMLGPTGPFYLNLDCIQRGGYCACMQQPLTLQRLMAGAVSHRPQRGGLCVLVKGPRMHRSRAMGWGRGARTEGSLLKRRGVRVARLLGSEKRGVSVDSLGVFWMLRRTLALLQTRQRCHQCALICDF